MNGWRLRRRLAQTFIAWAQQVLPDSRRSWGDAMQNELPHIADDSEAWHWAAGCLIAACEERIRMTTILDSAAVRVALILLLAFKIFDDLFATMITLAYKLSAPRMAEGLGQMTPGDDYQRLVPLMEAIPFWIHGLWVLAAILYMAAIVLIILHKKIAYLLVLVALGIEILTQALSRPLTAATGVVVNPDPSFLAAVIIPFGIPLSTALVLWLAGRKAGRLSHQI